MKGDFLLFAGHQIESWIAEIEGTVRSYDHVVRAVEFLPFETIGENFIFSIRPNLDDRSQYARAIDQPMLAIEAVAVRVS